MVLTAGVPVAVVVKGSARVVQQLAVPKVEEEVVVRLRLRRSRTKGPTRNWVVWVGRRTGSTTARRWEEGAS